MEELFKNDKMYTVWDSTQNAWMFSRVGDKPIFYGESGSGMLRARPHFIQSEAPESLAHLPVWDSNFTEFFKEKKEISRLKRGFYAFGRSFLPPHTNGHVTLAIGIAILAYLLINTPSSLPSSNSINVTAAGQTLAENRMNISGASLALALAGTAILLFLGAYTSYNEKPENIKWYQKMIEEEIKAKEAVISSVISFLSIHFLMPIDSFVFADLITAMEDTKSPQRYKKTQDMLNYLSQPENHAILKVAIEVTSSNLSAASVDDLVIVQNRIVQADHGEAYLKRKGITFALELLNNNMNFLVHLQKVSSVRKMENIGKVYKKISKVVKYDLRALEYIKEINQYLDKINVRNEALERYIDALQNMNSTVDNIRQAIFTCHDDLHIELRRSLRQ